MDVLCQEFKEHYHIEQPLQGLDNELIVKPVKRKKRKTSVPQIDMIHLSDVQCHERLGGLLKSYERNAA